jgi:hypothetical protein
MQNWTLLTWSQNAVRGLSIRNAVQQTDLLRLSAAHNEPRIVGFNYILRRCSEAYDEQENVGTKGKNDRCAK